jgi:hypothetical protein
MVSHHEVVRDTTEFGLLRMTGVLAAITPSAALIQVLANVREYRQPAVAVAVWLAMFAAALWLVPRIRTPGLSAAESVAAVLLAVAAVTVIGWEHREHDAPGSVDLAILGTVWLLALVALSRPARAWIPAALIVFAASARGLLVNVQVISDPGIPAPEVARGDRGRPARRARTPRGRRPARSRPRRRDHR